MLILQVTVLFKEMCDFDAAVVPLPLRHLTVMYSNLCDVRNLLKSLARGPMTQTLESVTCKPLRMRAAAHNYDKLVCNLCVALLAASFKRLHNITIDFHASDLMH